MAKSMVEICRITGFKCSKECRQYSVDYRGCELLELRKKAVKFNDLADIIKEVISLTDPEFSSVPS